MTTGRLVIAATIAALSACTSIGDQPIPAECNPSDFECSTSGACVPREQVCNGRDNCADGSDETNCLERCERRSDYRCKDGETCVSADSICDGREDCPGGDDEATCASTSCSGFQCQDGSCIDADQKCNGEADCLLAEDEAASLCAPTRCGDDDLRCSDGETCVPPDKICDENPECPEGDDEDPEMCADRETEQDPKDPDRPGTDPGKPSDNKPDEGRPCVSIDEKGLCDGNVLVWCDNGQVERKDCTRDNQKVCIKVSDDDGHACIPGANTPPEPDECGDVTPAGHCEGDTVVFCARGKVRRQNCSLQRPAKTCSEEGTRAHCEAAVPQGETDACQGIPEGGMCDGENILVHCKDGQPERYDCSAGGMKCAGDTGASECVPKAGCEGAASDGTDLTYQGECTADGTLRYCFEGAVEEVACASYGLGCDLYDEEVGYSCIPDSTEGCGDYTFEGTCEDNTVKWCEDDRVWTFDCGDDAVCGDVTLNDGQVVAGCNEPEVASCRKPDGGDYCGDYTAVPGSDPECHCDEYCDSIGDCCPDREEVCGTSL